MPLTDEQLTAWEERYARFAAVECGPDEFCTEDDPCPNHDSYFAAAVMPRLIADLRASRAEVERLREQNDGLHAACQMAAKEQDRLRAEVKELELDRDAWRRAR